MPLVLWQWTHLPPPSPGHCPDLLATVVEHCGLGLQTVHVFPLTALEARFPGQDVDGAVACESAGRVLFLPASGSWWPLLLPWLTAASL